MNVQRVFRCFGGVWALGGLTTGAIPASLGNMVTARKIFLNNNSIEGTIPATLGNLSSLRVSKGTFLSAAVLSYLWRFYLILSVRVRKGVCSSVIVLYFVNVFFFACLPAANCLFFFMLFFYAAILYFFCSMYML